MNNRIVIASGNRHKIAELQELFDSHGLPDVELVAMTDLVGAVEIDETGQTFEENAFIKAQAIHAMTGLPVLADDSGLCVDVLGGAPGVRSARYAGVGASDADNRQALRYSMVEAGVEDSAGRFVCVLWYIDDQRSFGVEGIVTGTIQTLEQGEQGFGYDAMFTPDGSSLSYGQTSSEEKARTSHRARASAQMVRRLAALQQDEPPANGIENLTSVDDLCRLSVAVVRQDTSLLRAIADRVTDVIQARRVTEALLQSYLFAGFPAALDALGCVAHRWNVKGLSDTDVPDEYNVDEFRRRGEELCRSIYGSVYDKMMDRFESVSPSMRSWMIVEGYGKTLSRAGLTSVERELCIICMLAALERPSQLYSHVRGALAIGADQEMLRNCEHVVAELCGANAARTLSMTIDTLMTGRS